MRFKVALLQINPHGSDQLRNLEKGLQYCRRAKALGADLVVFPELWNIGSAQSLGVDASNQQIWLESAIDRQSVFFRRFTETADELKTSVAITYLERSHAKPRNSVAIINSSGDVVLNYSKVCLCDFVTDDGNDTGCDVNCSPGESFPVCALHGTEGDVRIGAMICADREFPEPATQLMLKSAELIIVPNACDWDEGRSAGLATRAGENLLAVAMANYPRPLNNGNSRAYSCVAWEGGKPQNTLIAAAGEVEQILMAEFDFGQIRSFRLTECWRLAHRHRLSRISGPE